LEALKKALDIEPGETTPDNRWTFLTTSCLGVCGIGPVMLVDTDLYGNLEPEQIPHILSRYD
jgi:NADH:ubiquinone oxidoreductase subunit E